MVFYCKCITKFFLFQIINLKTSKCYTALSFKKKRDFSKIVLFYSANSGGFSSLAYLFPQPSCVYKFKSRKPLNILYSTK